MKTLLAYTALILFTLSIVFWYISGRLLKRNKDSSSRKMFYIGGFLFSFSLLSGLIAIAV